MFATRLQNNTGFPTHAASPIPGSEHISQGFFVFSRFLKALLIQEEKKKQHTKGISAPYFIQRKHRRGQF